VIGRKGEKPKKAQQRGNCWAFAFYNLFDPYYSMTCRDRKFSVSTEKPNDEAKKAMEVPYASTKSTGYSYFYFCISGNRVFLQKNTVTDY